MILIKGLPFVFLVFVERITFSITCTCEDEILLLQEAVNRYSQNSSKLGICNNSSSSSLENTTQQIAQPESTSTSSDASQNVTNGIAEENTITTILTPPATTSGDIPSITTASKESASDASIACDCPSNGLFAGAAFTGLFIGVFTTGSISFFLHKRWTSSNKGRALSNSLYELNEIQSSTRIRPTAGETYTEIENESQSPKISYVLPLTKAVEKSSTATNDPKIYHHLREDYDVKDRSNYYDHAKPLNGQQEMESGHYGKLAIAENGAYSTVTNTNKTGPELVRNEAYSTIETSEFQFVEVEGNKKDNDASYFVLTKE